LGATQKLLRFGIFELNLDSEELRKDGIPIKLPPQPFRILALLASHAGQVITREEIQQQIWGGETYVDFEHGLNQCIKQIRTALADNADKPFYVETIPRKGYRFLAPVTSKTVKAPVANVVEAASSIRPAIGSPATGSASAAPAQAVAAAINVASPAHQTKAPSETRPPAKRSRVAFSLAGVVLALVAGTFYWYSQKANALNERETVVLADFNNATGTALFDNSLKEALGIKLEESPSLNVLPDRRIAETLKLMNRAANERLTKPIAREICQRTNSKVYVAGSVAQIGHQYLLTLKAISCDTDDTVASVEEKAENNDRVLTALDHASIGLRKKLGESLASLRQHNKPLEEVTTSSLEALQAFSQARRSQMTGIGDPIPYLKHALELDPNFAPAYAALGSCYFNLNQTNLAILNYKKAFELRDRVTERERFLIDGLYYGFATGQLDKAIQVYTEWIQTYPEDEIPHATLGVIYSRIGQYEKAANEMRERMRLTSKPDYNIVEVYGCLDRLDEAQALIDRASSQGAFLDQLRYYLSFLRGDNVAAQQNRGAAQDAGEMEGWFLSAQSDTFAYHGQIAKARQYSRQAAESARRGDVPEAAATWKLNQALREAELGNFAEARSLTAEVVDAGAPKDTQAAVALVCARSHDLARAQKIVDLLNASSPLDTMVQGYSLPTVRAVIEMQKNNSGGALEILQASAPYELGNPSAFGLSPPLRALYPVYVRGQAYLQAGRPREAAVEFQKVIDHSGIVWNFVLGALARLQLGRAQAMLGDHAAARKSYQDFLTLWKDADPDLPIYKQAQAEYTKLQ